MDIKRCFRCTKTKPTNKFYKNKAQFDGLDGLCKSCRDNYHKNIWAVKNKGKCRASTAKWARSLKAEGMRYYCQGEPRCQCPGCDVKDERFLTFDHSNNDGAAHRKSIGGRNITSLRLLNEMKRKGWPPVLQVLCYNCNMGKQRVGKGICPHMIPLEV